MGVVADHWLPARADTTLATPGTVGRCGDVPVKATRELRGMWLTTVNNGDFPSKGGLDEATVKAEYIAWLDLAVKQNHNAIFVHIRPSGDALWPSAYAPWSQWLTGSLDGRDPGWDPLAFMVAEAHARNLEFHAWMNPYRGDQPATVGGPGGDVNKLAPNHPLRAHPDWAIVYPKGTSGSRFYFDPGNPDARRFVEDSMLEPVRKYDIDGVHFDDFFYPYPEAGQDFDDARSYAAYGQGKNKADWRRENVNTLVREMNQRIKAIKPWVKFGISPSGIWRNQSTDPQGSATRGFQSYDTIYADTRGWVRNGWLDYIAPQVYWYIGFDIANYETLLKWWVNQTTGTKVQLYIGQADYRVGESGVWSDPAELERQIALNHANGVWGSIHFSAKNVRADPLGAVTLYHNAFYATPAFVPTMAHLPAHPPSAPDLLGREDLRLRWRPAGNSTAMFGVYRVQGAAANLIATVRNTGDEQSWSAPGPGTYCVSALDRSWTEGPISPPITLG
jgi:uncharacterized lipoprotein YddW (UPF0748 family)